MLDRQNSNFDDLSLISKHWLVLTSSYSYFFYYYYEISIKIKIKVEEKSRIVFFYYEFCQLDLEKKNQIFSFGTNSLGFILTIGSRRSNQYSRIYQKQDVLRFEHEMKGRFLIPYHFLLVSNSLEKLQEFEQKLTIHYLKHLGTLLPLEQPYLDWLVSALRPLRQDWFSPVALKLDSLKEKEITFTTFETKTNFIQFLQFLTFANSLDYEIGCLDSRYRKVVFRVQDFLKYQNPSTDSINYYQLNKLRLFLDDLPSNSLIQFFSRSEFRSLVTIPDVKLIKTTNNVWIANVWIAEELFQYSHPFLFPDFFNSQRLSKHQFAILFEFISVFTSTVGLEKRFQLDQFFDTYSKISNEQKRTMKEAFLDFIRKFHEKGLIEDSIQIISSKTTNAITPIRISQLQVSHLSDGFILYEKLVID